MLFLIFVSFGNSNCPQVPIYYNLYFLIGCSA